MTDALLELETLVAMAALESHNRLLDVQALRNVAIIWLESRDWCVTSARFVIGAGEAPEIRASQIPLEKAISTVLNSIVFYGLNSSSTSELINLINDVLSKLEDERRAKLGLITLELTAFAVIEAVKTVIFGRNLNIAERSSLRGLYQRERLLQQI